MATGGAVVLALAVQTLAAGGPGRASAEEPGTEVVRYAGGSRAGTSAAISANLWEDGADTVVIANGDDFPDALSGAPLAASLDAPLLLASRDALDPTVEEELARLAPTTAVLLGGTAVLSDDLEEALVDAGVEVVDRIAGGDRYATAVAAANAFEPDQPTAYLVSGENWPDAVAVAFLAAWQGVPLLLTGRDGLPDATRAYLTAAGTVSVTVVGGEAVVDDKVLGAVADLGVEVTRLSGRDRIETSEAVVMAATAGNVDSRGLWVATSADFPDALSAAPAVAREGAALQLVDSGAERFTGPAQQRVSAWGPEMRSVRLVGGGAALPSGYEDQIRQSVMSRPPPVPLDVIGRDARVPAVELSPLSGAAAYRAYDLAGVER